MTFSDFITRGRKTIADIYAGIPAMYQEKLLPSIEALQKSEWWQKAKDPQNHAAIFARAEEWLKNHSNSGPVYRLLQEATAALRRLSEQDKLFTKRNTLILTAVILYTISPMDAVPDMVPLIGLLDDLGLLTLALGFILNGGKDPEKDTPDTPAPSATPKAPIVVDSPVENK